jgi:hypothetical protein
MSNSFIQTVPSQSYKIRVIYCYSIPGDSNYAGAVKVGMTEAELSVNATEEGQRLVSRNAAEKRVKQNLKEIYGQVNVNNLPGHILHWFETTHISIVDHQIHAQLKNNGISQPQYAIKLNQREWFNCDPATAKSAFDSVVVGLPTMINNKVNFANIVLRPEQARFVSNTLNAWHAKDTERLWNAKPRFGKTFTALEFLGEARNAYLRDPNNRKIEKVLILTHRPVVNMGWAADFTNIMSQRWGAQNWQYASKDSAHQSLEQVKRKHLNDGSPYIYFVSMQDARGKGENGFKDSNGDLFATDWDLVIIDEAHEGNLTELAQEVHNQLSRSFSLFLSGTPFRHLANGTFDGKTDSWDYVDEQEAKACWDYNKGMNPYVDLPRMWIYTLDLAQTLRTNFGPDEETGSFSFTELFAIDNKGSSNAKFKHEEDIRKFLDVLTEDDAAPVKMSDGSSVDMPYSDNGRRDSRHSVWVLPHDGVKAASLLEKMLRAHPEFSKYTIVNVAGDAAGPKPLAKVENAIYNGNTELGDPTKTKTITLTVGRLTTGVTVGPWTTIVMLNNMNSAEAYMQTIFRVQSPHTYNGMVKTECFVYDFAPDRALSVIAEAHNISSKAGHSTKEEAIIRLQQLTNYLPILSSVDRGSLERADAGYITRAVKRIYRERVLEAGFDTVLLFRKDLQNLSEEQRAALDEVRIAAGKNSPTTKKKVDQSIVIAANGLNNYQYAATDEELAKEVKVLEERIKEKPVNKRTPEELAEIEERKAEIARRENIRNILRTMSVRIPAMCIALVAGGSAASKHLKENFTLENFVAAFKLADGRDDVESWREFFGTITKETFLTLAPCFDEEVLQVAVEGWIRELESTFKLRDEYSAFQKKKDYEIAREKLDGFEVGIQGIMSRIKNPNKETVFTPYPVVGRQYEITGFTLDPMIIDEMRESYHNAESVSGYPTAGDIILDHCFKGAPWKGFRKPSSPTPMEFGKAIFTSDQVMPTFYDINVKSGLYPLYAAIQIAKANPDLSWEDICNNLIYANSRTLAGKWITCAILGMPRDWGNITTIDVYEELLAEDLVEAKLADEEKQQFVGHFLLAPLRNKRFRNDEISDITNESHRARVIEIIKQGRKRMADEIDINDDDGSTKKLNQGLGLRFDFVVSNPPYQINVGVNGQGKSIWQEFLLISAKIGNSITIINPGRWRKGGKATGLTGIREWLMSNSHLSKVVVIPENDAFPTVSGMVDVTIESINNNRVFENARISDWSLASGHSESRIISAEDKNDIILDPRHSQIANKISALGYPSAEKALWISGQDNKTKRITSQPVHDLRADYGIMGESRLLRDPDYFIDEEQRVPGVQYVKIWYKKGRNKEIAYKLLPRDEFQDTEKNNTRIPAWKAAVPATGAEAGYRKEIPFGGPNTICTPSWLCRSFDSKELVEGYLSYYKTYLYRFLVSIRSTGRHAKANVHRFVPDLAGVANPRTGKVGYQSDWIDDDLVEIFKDVLTPEDWCHIKKTAVAADNGRGDYEAGWTFPDGSTYKSLTKIDCSAVMKELAASMKNEVDNTTEEDLEDSEYDDTNEISLED